MGKFDKIKLSELDLSDIDTNSYDGRTRDQGDEEVVD